MFSENELQGFAKAAHSLKLYRRADLRDDVTDLSLIKKLYVDPLQGEAVLETMLRDSTTFLIGRKGTGKSTIFQRAQHELRDRDNAISAYVDIKTVFEASEVDPAALNALTQTPSGLDANTTRKLLLYRAFIKAVLSDIKIELKKHVSSSGFNKVLDALKIRRSDVTSALDEILESSAGLTVTEVTGITTQTSKIDRSNTKTQKSGANLNGAIGGSNTGPSGNLSAGLSAEHTSSNSISNSDQYTSVLLRNLNITGAMEDIQRVLGGIGINKLFIFVDDFSELPEEAMRVFVDTILSPLNNWSNELIKFKIAAYPGRIYYGKIDPAKVDEIFLDVFRLYGGRDVTTMEDKGADFTKRLIESRFYQYTGTSFSAFCDSEHEAIMRELFYASMANPRILGHILSNLRDSVTAYGRLIGLRAVRDASARYYEEKVEPFFGIQKFAHESFSERSSIFSLKELLETLIKRARDLRDYKESRVTREIRGRTPSSHFYVTTLLESALRTLELNFFLTVYYEMKDRDGNSVTIYALNHGLCQKLTITFGRPSGLREHRLYYVERIFDYSSIVKKFLEKNQEIKCTSCGAVHGLDKLDGLRMYGMLCPDCKQGICEVTNLSKKYEAVLRDVDPNLLLPSTELGILEALYTEHRSMVASEIAGELDCSYQLVGKRAKILSERGLVTRAKNESNRRIFSITEDAKAEYFDGNIERKLDLPDE